MSRKILIGCVTLVIVILSVLTWLTWPLIVNKNPVYYADIDEHFRYGSIGGESTDGIPYWLWKALPAVFPDKLPPGSGWTSFGFIQEPDHEMPIGFAKSTRSIGLSALNIDLFHLDVVTQNCATCHVSTLRETPESKPRIISTMPGNTIDLQSYIQFLINVAVDERFTASYIMPTIAAMGANLNPLEKLIYTYFVIPQARESLLRERHDLLFMEKQSKYGPGRVDTFTTYKTRRFGFPGDKLPPEELNGVADFPSIWNQKPRQGIYLHWDGNNDDPDERNRTAALALVAPANLNFDSLFRLQQWLREVQPPMYPYNIDQDLAQRGQAVYNANCARCHEILSRPDRDGLETVVPIDELGTDRGRLDSYTYELASNQYQIFSGIQYRGEDKRFRHYRKTNGYASQPLDGIWLRAPYLHNGSVATLRDLLNKPEERPKTFYRAYDVYDRENVGFISTVAQENGKFFFKYDTSLPGNGNGGHLYGTELSKDDKSALIEYLKTK